ncbi:MAG: WecB/TagA/CpsF family glycosyltransferase [Agathobacter sp.]|nr:WecB/TagA/CpsF family glycosyltransferase [Agathobacter sp.]
MQKYFDKLYKKDFHSFIQELESNIKENKKAFIITANPETLMIGVENPAFDAVLKSEDSTIVADGIGVVKAAQMLGMPVDGRVPGVEISQELFRILNENQKGIYLLGAKREVLETLVKKLQVEYPNLRILGYTDGYVQDKDAVFDEIVQLKPDAVLVALGIPAQEILIHKHYDRFEKGIFVGVGGSFDVLSGTKKRAPEIFIKLNLEWLYRIAKEPKRFKRFYDSNVKFIGKIRKMRKK